ncbi:hypothetical protein F5Y03DRAFT_403406 [Xylaria venustula]|nr:hypothetical protein F5Y03DRAFT_403406 [Xylaria venustula]
MSSSISCLPDSATQLISSHVVVVTPCLLVKELLDNAVDAEATSVEILISPDTCSRIEVRDNGVGIHPDDFDVIGRHSHTSKLKHIEELGHLFGKSLGFRGEALASVNSIANVNITTKISTEPTATTFQLKPNEGGMLSPKSASAPVGTTVSVTDLFVRQPVRQQMAVKEAKKTLDKIQHLLRSYIMARPQLKIICKVLQVPTKVWSYSPKQNATVIEAALQLFGSEAASNCLLKTFQASCTSTPGDSSPQELSRRISADFMLEALLANPDVDLRNISKCHYFSIDDRPMNTSRGVAKRLLKIYLEHLRRSTVVSDYFIRLNICCPPGSYDANVEPSKDDVLFSDEAVVEDAFRYMCSEVYKPVADRNHGKPCTAKSQQNSISGTDSMDKDQLHQTCTTQTRPILPNCTPQVTHSSHRVPIEVSRNGIKSCVAQASTDEKPIVDPASERIESPAPISFTPINAKSHLSFSQPRYSRNEQSNTPLLSNQCKVDMSIALDEPLKQIHWQRPKTREPRGRRDTEISGERNLGDHLNPWEIAKMNNSSKTSLDAAPKYAPDLSSTPEPPILNHIMAPPGDLDVPRSHEDTERTNFSCLPRHTVPGGPYRSPVASPSSKQNEGAFIAPFNSSRTIRRRRKDQIPWTPPSSIEKNRYIDVSHVDPSGPPRAEGLKQTQISFGGTRSSHRQGGMQSGDLRVELQRQRSSDELEANRNVNMQDIFSTAKKNLHDQLTQTEGDKPTKVTHNDVFQRHHQQSARLRKPFNVLQTNTFGNGVAPRGDRQPIATSLPIGDPRAYLLRRQKSIAAGDNEAKLKKTSRLKSSLMPLESTPPEYETHIFSSTVIIHSSSLEKSVREARDYDKYVIYGALVDGLDMSLSDGRIVESQLQKLLAEQKENIGDRDTNIDSAIVDLHTTLKRKKVSDT